jgi:acyl-CoA synthetase (AMP-forming)/AMP-acid ligase II
VFKAPLIESYGMTEAAHQMASNPLPPAKRIPGSVGIAAGPEVAIMDNEGQPACRPAIGEIVIRGENVTAGYENNPKANAEAYTHGWFRTGDQGVLDADGYLTLTGRLKEIINRGGEKMSPREVDEVLMDHPAVAQVVTFACRTTSSARTSAAAVVLREGMDAHRAGAARLRGDEAGRLQGAAQGAVPGRDPQGRHRQAPADRPGRETRPDRLNAASCRPARWVRRPP